MLSIAIAYMEVSGCIRARSTTERVGPSSTKIRRLRDTESELCIDIDVIVQGKDIGGVQLRLWQTHHLSETSPDTAIEIRHPHGSNDGDASRTLDHDWTAVQPGITDPLALVGCQIVGAFHHTIDGNRHSCADITNDTKS